MLIQLCIELIVLLIAIYYITVVIHFLGFNIFKGKKIEFGKAFIPFYAWITRNINEGNPENFEDDIPELKQQLKKQQVNVTLKTNKNDKQKNYSRDCLWSIGSNFYLPCRRNF